MRKLALLLCLLAGSAFASDIVIFDPNHPDVTNAVKNYRVSVNTPDFSSRPNVLINPNVSAVRAAGVPVRHWKVSLPSTVLEMTQAEKDLIDADAIQNRQRRTTLRTRLNTLNQRLTDWDTMTNAQKFAAMKLMLQWLRIRDQLGNE